MKKLVFLLPLFSSFNGLSLKFLGISLRLDQIAVIFLSIIIFLHKKIVSKEKIVLSKEYILLVLFFIVSLGSSILNSPDKLFSVVQTINIITNSLAFFVVVNTLNSIEIIVEFLVFGFNTVLLISIISLLLFLFSYISGTQLYGINLTQNQNEAFGVFFTMREPNVFGSYMILYFLLAFVLYIDEDNSSFYFKKSFLSLVLVFTGISILLSFTRGAWLAVLLSIFTFYLFSLGKVKRNYFKIILMPVVVLFIFFILSNVLKIEFLSYKLDNFVSTKGGTSEARLWVWFKALDNWINQKNYLIGNGTFSFASFFNVGGYSASTNAWIGNMPLTILHDTGVIGFIFFFLFYVSLVVGTFVVLKKAEKNHYLSTKKKSILIPFCWGFVLGIVGIFIAFFFTVALNYTYPWLFMGLLIASRNLLEGEVA